MLSLSMRENCARWKRAGGAATIAVANPSDGGVISHVPKLGSAETRRAIEAAETAQRLY
jgi:succinate-semialdehyde dehydrogenase / glutarate-semialdehyde dehydrogenase